MRLSRNSQRELAEAIGLHPKVLGRKLSPNSEAVLSNPEVRDIVKTLAKWRAILTQPEAIELLALMKSPPFTTEEWLQPPLSWLEIEDETDSPVNSGEIKEPEKPPVAELRAGNGSVPVSGNEVSKNNLPTQLTSFVGRHREIAEIKQLLVPADDRPAARLVTLTGAGGNGKSRLSFEVAAQLLGHFADGVWLVELAFIADPAIIPQTIAEALDVIEQANRPILKTLADYLKKRHLLLVLDNCEHLIVACAEVVTNLLRFCPGLQVLATSREALRVPGEITFQVAPLALPDTKKKPDIANLLNYEAIQLFVDRAKIANSHFTVSTENQTDLVQLCHRLDGNALAIELAAARSNVLTVDQINARLDDRFRLLRASGNRTALPRQQTLRGLIDWSYNLLSETEKLLFRRLSVFTGGFSLDAAEMVGSGEEVESYEILDILSQLVNKSLVLVEEEAGNQLRYSYLETLRKYALEQLDHSGEAGLLRRKHLDYFVELAEAAFSNTVGGQQESWFRRLDREQDNFRTALGWATENYPEAAMQLSGALGRYWYVRCNYSEGLNWLQATLANFGEATDEKRKEQLARSLYWMATLAMPLGQYQQATPLYERSLQLSRELGDKRNITIVLNRLGELARNQGRYDQASQLLEECLTLARQLGEQEVIANALCNRGEVAWDLGDYQQAQAFYQESFKIFSHLEDQINIAKLVLRLGQIARVRGRYNQAQAMFEQSQATFEQRLNLWGIASTLHRQGLVAFDRGDYSQARQLFEQSLALFSQHGDKWGIAEQYADLGNVSLAQGELIEAGLFFEDSLAIYREIGIKSRIANLIVSQGELALGQGDYGKAKKSLEEGLAFQRELATRPGIAKALELLGQVAYREGHYGEALDRYNESLALNREMNDQINIARCLEGLSNIYLATNESEKAAQFAGEAATIRAASGIPADRSGIIQTIK